MNENEIMKSNGWSAVRKVIAAVGTVLLALISSVAAYALQNLPTVVMDMEEDPVSGLIVFTLTADSGEAGLGNIYFQVDHGRSVKYTGPFRVAPQQTVSAYISYAPMIKGETTSQSWPGDARAVAVGLRFLDGGAILVSRDMREGRLERFAIDQDDMGDVDLINLEGFARLAVSRQDRDRLRNAAVSAGYDQMEAILRRDGGIPGTVWLSFWAGGRPVSLELKDSYLYLPHEEISPQLIICEAIRDPDGLNKDSAGQLARTVADGEMAAVCLPGPGILAVSKGQSKGWGFSGWAKPSLDYAVSHDIFHPKEKEIWRPGTSVTMGQFLTLLYRSQMHAGYDMDSPYVNLWWFDEKELESSAPWCGEALDWAVSKNLLYSAGRWYLIEDGSLFYLDMPLNREDAALLLWNFAGRPGAAGMNPFQESWERLAMEWAEGNGILTRQSGKGMDPAGVLTLEAAAEVLRRLTRLQAGLGSGERLTAPSPKTELPAWPQGPRKPPAGIFYRGA